VCSLLGPIQETAKIRPFSWRPFGESVELHNFQCPETGKCRHEPRGARKQKLLYWRRRRLAAIYQSFGNLMHSEINLGCPTVATVFYSHSLPDQFIAVISVLLQLTATRKRIRTIT
jgi:hypothetical protein